MVNKILLPFTGCIESCHFSFDLSQAELEYGLSLVRGATMSDLFI